MRHSLRLGRVAGIPALAHPTVGVSLSPAEVRHQSMAVFRAVDRSVLSLGQVAVEVPPADLASPGDIAGPLLMQPALRASAGAGRR